MKIILSRKGFDSTAGKIPNPILPDGTLLSFPIPAKEDKLTYADLYYDGISYANILSQLNPKDKKITKWNCHLDPDIRPNIMSNSPADWQAAFGQINSAQSYLKNNDINVGDLFLFFGWFKQTEGDFKNGSLRYVKDAPDLHVIFGYLQIGKMISDPIILKEKYLWHPHSLESRAHQPNNMLYLPSEHLSFNNDMNGYGVFDFANKRVLTQENSSRATWKEVKALLPDNLCRNVKNSAKNGGLYYKGQWQEMMLKENNISESWAESLF